MSNVHLKAEFFRTGERTLPTAPSLLARLRRWRDRLHCQLARAEQRRALTALDDRMLGDIGVSRAEVSAEIAKPCWRC